MQRLVPLHITEYFLKLLVATALYTFSSRTLLNYFAPDDSVSIFFIASGVALATVLIGDSRYALSIFLGSTLSNSLGGLPIVTAMVMGIGSTLGAMLAADWLTRYRHLDLSLSSLSDWLKLMLWGGCFGCSINAVIGSTALLLTGVIGVDSYFSKITHWWMGDALGVFIVTPFILTVWQARKLAINPKQLAEALLMIGLSFLVGQVVFLGWFNNYLGQIANSYWMFVLITWIALRLNTQWMTLFMVMTAIQALQGVYSELGIIDSDIIENKALNYWLYLIALSCVGITLSTFITTHRYTHTQKQEALERLEKIASRLPGMVYSFRLMPNGDTCFPYSSAAIEAIYRVSPEEVQHSAAKVFARLHPDDYEQVVSSMNVSAQNLTAWQQEYRVRFDDGTVRWLYGNSLPQREKDGATLWHGFITDITEIKQIHVAEQEQHVLLLNVINSLSHPFYVVNTDDYTVQLANQSAGEWLRGITTCYQLSHKQNFPCVIATGEHPCPIEEVKRTKKPLAVEHLHYNENGDPRIVEVFAYPIFDAAGEVHQIIEYAIDITERKQTEQRLKQSEAHFRNTFEFAPIGVVNVALNGRFLAVNQTYCDIIGYSRKELLTMTVMDIIRPQDKAAHAQLIQQLLAGKIKNFCLEKQYVRKDGSLVWSSLSAQLNYHADGTPDYFIATVEDITERKQSQNEILATKNELQATLNAIPDLLFELDLDGRYYNYHARRTELLAVPPEQILGKTITDILPPDAAAICLSALQEAHQQDWSTGKQIELEFDQGTHWFELSVAVKQTNGEQPRFIMLSRDITDRKLSEIAIAESQKLLRTIIDTSPIRVFWKDRNLYYLGCNRLFAKDAGMASPNDIIGKNDYQMGWAEQAELYRADDCAVMESGIAKLSYDEPQTTPSGETIWLRTSKVPLKNQQNEIIGLLGVYEDITERKRIEHSLAESEFRWKFAIEGSGDGVWDWNIQTNEALYSKRWLEMLGYSEDDFQLSFDAWATRIHPDDQSYVTEVLYAYLAGETACYTIEYRLRCKDESYKWILARGILVSRSEDGKPLRMIGTHTDISQRKLMEQQLRDSEAFTNSILNSLTSHIAVLNAEGTIIAVNNAWRQFAEMNGLPEMNHAMLGADYLAACQKAFNQPNGEEASIVQQGISAVLAGSCDSFYLEYPCHSPTQQRWFYMNVSPLKGAQQGVVISHENITKRKQMEEVLKASEARFRSIIDVSPVPMALNDEYGNITFLNTAFVQTFGYDTTDIPILSDWWFKAYPDPDYRLWVVNNWQAAMETSEREQQPFVPQEINIHCKNGAQKTVLASAAAISESFHSLHLVVLYDITERKQIETALRNSEQRLNEAERIAQMGNWEFDFLTNTLNWSDGIFKIFDIDKKQFAATYTAFRAAIHPDDRAAVNAAYAESLKTHQPYSITHRLLLSDGQIKQVHEQCETYFDCEGKPIRSIGTVQDITERKAMEAELRRSNAELEQFAYAVSHDMRQPLRMVSSYLSIIETALASQLDEDTQQCLKFAIDGAKRMDAMILSLLEYSRVGRRTEPLSLIPSRAAVDEALAFLKPELVTSGGNVEVTGEWIDLIASRDELTRLLQNLIGNALKYHEENKPPQVEVRATVTANMFKVAVRDSGIGIDPKQIDRLFKVFSRLQARTRFEGTGVGLALCRKIVEHHGGQIGVESAGEGLGSVFWFELPLASKE